MAEHGFRGKYVAVVGENRTRGYDIEHGLGTLDVVVAVYDDNGVMMREADGNVIVESENTIRLQLRSEPGHRRFRVVVLA